MLILSHKVNNIPKTKPTKKTQSQRKAPLTPSFQTLSLTQSSTSPHPSQHHLHPFPSPPFSCLKTPSLTQQSTHPLTPLANILIPTKNTSGPLKYSGANTFAATKHSGKGEPGAMSPRTRSRRAGSRHGTRVER
ncbi:hypothetical protein CONLIGDRAFT_638603 [Coniochaeta ligniaria NRRL 30616]|uniref:Uncharacterized protein n=1 Tax=Coniochaeta ligniaria NRRL 30616 TaxID=1408157 RepID=A0A1J7IYX5_9PEZI|nr:hypothetical protein CONLIGDRAFT_638603 [Coniochaeta ligniaria NRRL 30616]